MIYLTSTRLQVEYNYGARFKESPPRFSGSFLFAKALRANLPTNVRLEKFPTAGDPPTELSAAAILQPMQPYLITNCPVKFTRDQRLFSPQTNSPLLESVPVCPNANSRQRRTALYKTTICRNQPIRKSWLSVFVRRRCNPTVRLSFFFISFANVSRLLPCLSSFRCSLSLNSYLQVCPSAVSRW